MERDSEEGAAGRSDHSTYEEGLGASWRAPLTRTDVLARDGQGGPPEQRAECASDDGTEDATTQS